MTPIKVLHVISRLNVGGAALYVISLTSQLKKRGHDVKLIHGIVDSTEGDIRDYLDPDVVDVPLIEIPELGRNIAPWKDVIALWKLIRLFRREKPDIIHTHTSKAGCLGRLAAFLSGVPVRIHSVHSSLLQGFFSRRGTKILIWVEWVLGKITTLVFACTGLVRKEMIDSGIVPPEKIEVMPLGIDLEPYREVERFRGVVRSKLQLASEITIIGIIARLVPIKGVEVFLEAAHEIASEFPKVHFVITGDGALRNVLESKAKELRLGGRVTFLGFWKDLREIYADYDFLVLSSLYEGCPIAILEGMACGKPIIASAVGGVPDVIRNEINGLLFPAKDARALANGLRKLLKETSLSSRLGAAAKQDVFQKYTISKSAELTEIRYGQLLKRCISRGIFHSLSTKEMLR